LKAAMHLPDFLLSPYWSKGLSLLREVRGRVPVIGVNAVEAHGKDKLTEVVFTTGAGERRMKADLLLLHQGVGPNVNLAMAAGVAHRWNTRALCFEPVVDADFGTSVPGIAVAGDGAGIAGGTAAAERGRIAALAAVQALKPDASGPNGEMLRHALAREEMGRA